MKRFRERPKPLAEVEAVQFLREVRPWPAAVRVSEHGGPYVICHSRLHPDYPDTHCYLGGGEWIVRHEDGRYEVMTEGAFRKRYEPVNEEPMP